MRIAAAVATCFLTLVGASTVSIAQETNASTTALAEVVVTAEKRSEFIQDVPVPVTAIGADKLISDNQVRLQDYFTSVPGLSYAPNNQNQYVTIRGITTGGFSNPTVGVVIDDVPFGASNALGGGQVIPDFDPGDLARVEVLRGPQGTLYGASSMGGLLKFVTVDPSTDGLSGRVEAGVSGVHNGDDAGYNVRGSVNIPLTDTLAARASAFTREDPGYINNPVRNLDGVNDERVSGARLGALWRPADDLSLKLNALYQQNRAEGSPQIDPSLGDLAQNYLPGMGRQTTRLQAYSANLNTKFWGIDLVAITGYNVSHYDRWDDYTFGLGAVAQQVLPGVDVAGTPIYEDTTNSRFTQEVRLSSSIGTKFDWLLGGFYDHERYSGHTDVIAVNSAMQDIGDMFNLGLFSGALTEYAAFGDLTYHFTDSFDLQVGGRESQIKITDDSPDITTGEAVPFLYGQPPPVLGTPSPPLKSNTFTYLVTPRWKLSTDLMLYARLASGYRAGGSNGVNPVPPTPAQYNSDKTKNYELGFKGSFLDHRLSVDASLYYIDWTGIQLELVNPSTQINYTINGSPAKSQGAELSVELRPMTGLTVSAWGAYSDAVLTQDFPSGSTAYGVAGNRLPLSPRISGQLSARQEFPLSNRLTGFVGAAVNYVGNREGLFISSPARAYYPAYARTDASAGVSYESWMINFFANNLTDRRGIYGGGPGMFPSFAYEVIQPRTVGMSVTKTF
jgi:iron complex outermembrane recepter protein